MFDTRSRHTHTHKARVRARATHKSEGIIHVFNWLSEAHVIKWMEFKVGKLPCQGILHNIVFTYAQHSMSLLPMAAQEQSQSANVRITHTYIKHKHARLNGMMIEKTLAIAYFAVFFLKLLDYKLAQKKIVRFERVLQCK